MDKILNETTDPFWRLRRCMREPIAEIFDAAELLSHAVDAHLANERSKAEWLFAEANNPIVRAWTESLWGSPNDNPDQVQYTRFRECEASRERLPKEQRIPLRMPNAREKAAIIEKQGRHCVFCSIPLIASEVRKVAHIAYPSAVPWGAKNHEQHAAFQCMWLQFDHLLPHSRGGDNSIENVAVTCAPCNFARMDNLLVEHGLHHPLEFAPKESDWDGLERWFGG